jgi:tRNA nucleotidyltransferase/poly(A) polymerase
MKQSNYAREIVQMLRDAGHESYFVGGCVRDMVMEIRPVDYDIATGALPEQVTALFPRTEPIGAKFGVILVIHHGHPFEVATFRSDEAYVDGRRPAGVVFTGPEEDVLRRDFTINGLLYDPIEDRIIDFVDGQADIKKKIVRAIGDPHQRFSEDKLRILRAIRFGARFGYTVEAKTWDAVCAMAPEIGQVSAERIRDELLRILVEGESAHGMTMLNESGLMSVVLPELSWDAHIHDCLRMLGPAVAPDFALGVLLHECDADDARKVADRLRLSNNAIDHVDSLVGNQKRFSDVDKMSQSELKRFVRIPRFEDHLELFRIHLAVARTSSEGFELARQRAQSWSSEDLFPKPLISGADLITLGFRPGPSFKSILTRVEDEQLEGRLVDHDAAIDFAREHFE